MKTTTSSTTIRNHPQPQHHHSAISSCSSSTSSTTITTNTNQILNHLTMSLPSSSTSSAAPASSTTTTLAPTQLHHQTILLPLQAGENNFLALNSSLQPHNQQQQQQNHQQQHSTLILRSGSEDMGQQHHQTLNEIIILNTDGTSANSLTGNMIIQEIIKQNQSAISTSSSSYGDFQDATESILVSSDGSFQTLSTALMPTTQKKAPRQRNSSNKTISIVSTSKYSNKNTGFGETLTMTDNDDDDVDDDDGEEAGETGDEQISTTTKLVTSKLEKGDESGSFKYVLGAQNEEEDGKHRATTSKVFLYSSNEITLSELAASSRTHSFGDTNLLMDEGDGGSTAEEGGVSVNEEETADQHKDAKESGNNNNNQQNHHPHHPQHHQQSQHQNTNNNSGYISLGPGGVTNNNSGGMSAITTTSSSSSTSSSASSAGSVGGGGGLPGMAGSTTNNNNNLLSNSNTSTSGGGLLGSVGGIGLGTGVGVLGGSNLGNLILGSVNKSHTNNNSSPVLSIQQQSQHHQQQSPIVNHQQQQPPTTQHSSSPTSSSAPSADLKDVIEELCPVCGDKVSGYHYGLLTCESCKGFFKRTVQNKKVYTCVAERSCHIDKTQRKRCPFCRFQKCLDVGMKLEAVRADRMRGGRNKFGPMYKRDRARKLQILRQRQLALQAIRGQISGPNCGPSNLLDGSNQSQLSPTGYQQPHQHSQSYNSMHIKQEIQIPQVSSLTSSPDSSPSPIAIALGQVNTTSGGNTSMSMGGINGPGNNNNNNNGGGLVGGPGNNNSGLGSGGGGGSLGGNRNIRNTYKGTNNNDPFPRSSTTQAASIQNPSADSKLWYANSTTASPHSQSPKTFNFDSNPTSTADSGSVVETLSYFLPRVSPMIREFVQSVDDREWQTQLFSLLQSQSYNQCEVDTFELMCKVLDQNLFSQVDWARNTIFFKDLKVDDQMKLLQHSWSDMLVLDHLHQRIHNGLPDETTLHNGQKFDLLGLGLLGVPQLAEHFNELQNKLQELKFDVGDYICMKFLLLLNPDVRGITNRKTILEGYENVQAALLDYTLTCYPSVSEKFSKLLSIIPEIHAMAARGEEHLYMKHCAGSAPTQTLLMEMLHAKRK